MNFSQISMIGWQDILHVHHMETLVAALVSAVATIALIKGFSPTRSLSHRATAKHENEANANRCEFLIEGSSVRALGEAAQALLMELDTEGSRLVALKAYLQAVCPTIQSDIEALVFDGTAFRHHCPKDDGTAVEIIGSPSGNAAVVSISPASEDARALRDVERLLRKVEVENQNLNEIIDQAPLLVWRQDAGDQVTWANKPYHDRFDTTDPSLPDRRLTNAFAHVLEEVPLTPKASELRRRVATSMSNDTEAQWFEISEHTGQDGAVTGFALETDELVAAENSLRRFVETLTETFAHLPIGLAVFDKNRRLGLFNPALTDLVKIDAVWLAGRPSLRDFLERLREIRQMPEQKDFASWRRKLGELEEGARDGTYEENWVLPSGKIFRVTGRPHPQGALAFLFEDISTSIMLERKYRSELELSQSTLDRLNEAVAVFDASGRLVIVNTAFERMWGLNQSESLVGPGIAELSRLWSERCHPSDIWSKVTDFTTSADARTNWTDTVQTLEGDMLELVVAPLPDASALVVFRKIEAALQNPDTNSMDTTFEDLALESIRGPAEIALQVVVSAIPGAQSPEAFQSLNTIVQGLKSGLSQSTELRSISRDTVTGVEVPMRMLTAALSRMDIRFDAPSDASNWSGSELRTATALVWAVADYASAGNEIELSTRRTSGSLHFTARCRTTVSAPQSEMARSALLRRVVEQCAGTVSFEVSKDAASLHAVLPAAVNAPHSEMMLGSHRT